MFAQTLAILAPILLCAGAGFLWKRFKQPFDSQGAALLVTEITAPCLVIATLSKITLDKQLIVDVGLYVSVAVAIMLFCTFVILKALRCSWQTFAATMTFGNHGYMGMPLCLYAFGEEGLALSVIYFAVTVIYHNTIGISSVSGHLSIRFVFTNPIILATLFSVLLVFAEWHLPEWLHNGVSLIGQITIPLMLFSLGVSLAGMTVQNAPRNFLLALLRTLACLTAGFGVAELFDLSGVVRDMIILEAAMPAAIFNYILAERYQQSPKDIASVILLSTLCAFVVLAFLIPYLLGS